MNHLIEFKSLIKTHLFLSSFSGIYYSSWQCVNYDKYTRKRVKKNLRLFRNIQYPNNNKMRTLCVLFVNDLSAFTANSPCQLYIFWHDRDTFGVNGAQIRVFEQADQVSFRRFLKGTYSGALKTQIGFEILRDFTNQTLERQFPDEQLRGLLISSDFSQSYSTGPVTMRLLDASSGRRAFTCRFGGKLLPGCLSTR